MKKNTKRKKINKNKKEHIDKLVIVLIVFVVILVVNIFFLLSSISSSNKDYKKLQQENKKIQKKLDEMEKLTDIIFLGDSITEYYDLDKYYDKKIIKSGVAGYTTDDILNNIDEMVFKYNPRKIFLLIGTNDLRDEKSIEYVTNNIEKIVNVIHEKTPYTRIYVESIYPVNNTDSSKISHDMVGIRKNEDIQEINKNIKDYCIKNKFTYINMYKELSDDDGNLKLEYTREGLHMSDEGYEVITKKLNRYI